MRAGAPWFIMGSRVGPPSPQDVHDRNATSAKPNRTQNRVLLCGGSSPERQAFHLSRCVFLLFEIYIYINIDTHFSGNLSPLDTLFV